MKLILKSKPSKIGVKFQEGPTYRDLLDPLFKITDKEEAKEYFNDYVQFLMHDDPDLSEEQALDVAKSNVGYWGGYQDIDTRMRIERLLDVEHPYLGKAKEKQYTPEEILQMGIELGKKIRPGGTE